ncbi:TM2 domain-containing protein [Altererythrobacter sp. ZODW24]|uniref:TM2 domain-containing protein n=1 Tax=Altererythrobacter sp. ZODW24 TaxID=2185142 RepID=UPI001966A72D|nr:TM2 domain-containing protein [Altererythrobacter sp. ZODW24]
MSGFGRKGLAEGAYAPAPQARFGQASRQPASAPPSYTESDAMADKRRAFLASERVREQQEAIAAERQPERPRQEVGLSDYAETFQGRVGSVVPERSLAMAYVLWFVLGQLSAHRFYLGRMQSAVAQVGMLFFSVLVAFTASPIVGGVALLVWALWLLGDVFFIHKIHREDWVQDHSVGAIFS